MSEDMRKNFERLFQLPIGVYWSGDNYMTTNNHFQCLEYRGAWSGYKAAKSELAALREELDRQKRYVEINANSAHGKHKEGQQYKDERDALQEELAECKRDRDTEQRAQIEANRELKAAEQRNADLSGLLRESLEEDDGTSDWFDRVIAALRDNPTESGASE